ncbi:hypothetical protein AB205_0191350 [Aquarana catesbeiana]|uniref:Secreted protein n=1 Tax=Aquarana catesbeiana TaxID=8400 RepID=A0A2G9RRR9_AQUCT|nr:hypothetical protein AB205_0191350 [Aquarana catesbeiana]
MFWGLLCVILFFNQTLYLIGISPKESHFAVYRYKKSFFFFFFLNMECGDISLCLQNSLKAKRKCMLGVGRVGNSVAKNGKKKKKKKKSFGDKPVGFFIGTN